jgi:hypothetical protein
MAPPGLESRSRWPTGRTRRRGQFNAGHGDTFDTTSDAELHNLMDWALAIEAGAATIEDVDALTVPEWSRRIGRVPPRENS